MRYVPILMVVAVLSAVPAAAADETEIPLARTPSEMSGAEIDAYNRGRAATDPGYIRCRRIEQAGSLVKKSRVCNTNAEWRRITDRGNQDARDTFDTIARGWSNSQEPPEQVGPQIQPQ